MQDAMQVAEKRIKEYRMAISKKENEIVELKERLEDLDNFLEFGQALVGKSGDTPAAKSDDTPTSTEDKVKAAAAAEAADDDEWGTDEDTSPINNGITRVLSQRTG